MKEHLGRLERQLLNEQSMEQDRIFVSLMRWAEGEGENWLEIMMCAIKQGVLE